MTMPRRKLLHAAAAAVALPFVSRLARAETYPSRPVRIIIGYTPGGSADMTARFIGQWLTDRFGQQFIVESRPGGSTNLATEAVVNAVPDGYTLLLVAPANAINATLFAKLNFDFLRDIVPVAGLIRFPDVMEVNPQVPVKTVPEFIAYAKANPGKLNMASSGVGSTIHVAGELFKMMTGVDMVHVPYRGGAPALVDMISGQDQVMFDNLPTSIEFIKAGKLRPLAVTTTARSEIFPELPTVADFVPGYEASAWYGVGAPKGTPADIVDRLNREINAAIAEPKAKAQLAAVGASLLMGSPGDFGKLIADETEKWGKSSGSPTSSRSERSIRFDIRRANDLAPFLGFASQHLAEFGGRAGDRDGAEIGETGLQFRIGHRRIDGGVELADDRRRRAFGRADADQPADIEAGHEFADGGRVGKHRRAVRRGHRERAQLAGSDLFDQRRDGVDHALDAAAEQIGLRGSGAAIRHVNQIDAGHHLEQFERQVRRLPLPVDAMLILPGLALA